MSYIYNLHRRANEFPTSVRLADSVRKPALARAKQEGLTFSGLVVRALDMYLAAAPQGTMSDVEHRLRNILQAAPVATPEQLARLLRGLADHVEGAT